MKLSELGEDAVVQRLIKKLPVNPDVVYAGAGDDCAVLRNEKDRGAYSLFKSDCLIQGVHFTPETAPERIGRKAMGRVLSDIAAMGGLPKAALITLIISPERTMGFLEKVYAGFHALAEEYDFSIVGGETSRPPRGSDFFAIDISMTGWVEKEKLVLRSGGRAGDALFVTGKLGGSFDSGRHLDFAPRLDSARWLSERFSLNAMMDLSDGLAADLPRLAHASNCGFKINFEALPLNTECSIENALRDGEDYELLFAASQEEKEEILAQAKGDPAMPKVTEIGELTPLSIESTPLGSGWDAFFIGSNK